MKKDFFSNFRKRDIVVVLVTIVALALLFVVIRGTRNKDRIEQQELINSSKEESNVDGENVTTTKVDRIVINEVDGNGNVELYNSGSREMSIGGYVVVSNGREFTIEDGVSIPAHGIYTFQTEVINTERNTNVLQIYDKKGQLMRAISFGQLSDGTSYGCLADGSYEVGYITSSIGDSNEGCMLVETDDITFSVPSGFYEESFALEISAPDNYKLYYTLDGTTPTTDSNLYESRITISRPSSSSYVYSVSDGEGYIYTDVEPKSVDMGTIVNVIAVDDKNEVVCSKTASYFIGYNNDSDYVGLPVISIEVDPKEMFGFESGIYVPGKSYFDGFVQGNNSMANYLKGSTAKAKIEYFESSKDKTYSSDVSISIITDERRGTEQKSLAVNAAGEYPEGTGLDKFLNSSSNSLLLLSGGGDSGSKMRSYFVKGILEGTTTISRDYQPCLVFIDGEYWGMYTLATNYDDKFWADNYGITDKVIKVETDYVSSSEYKEFYDYVVNTDFSVTENYQSLQSRMDISNYIEYMCANIFIGNTAMNRGFSACVFRTSETSGTGFNDGKWRWAINNVDNSLANTGSYLDPYTKGDYSTALMNTYLSPGIKDNEFFNSLLKNDSFAKEFEEKMNDLIENTFTEERANEVLASLDTTIAKAVYATNKRFSGNAVNQYEFSEGRIKNFFAMREKYLKLYTDEYIGQKGNVAGIISTTEEASEEASAEDQTSNNQQTGTN